MGTVMNIKAGCTVISAFSIVGLHQRTNYTSCSCKELHINPRKGDLFFKIETNLCVCISVSSCGSCTTGYGSSNQREKILLLSTVIYILVNEISLERNFERKYYFPDCYLMEENDERLTIKAILPFTQHILL